MADEQKFESKLRRWKYVATNIKGEKIKGVGFAESVDDLRDKLTYDDLFLKNAKLDKPSPFLNIFTVSKGELTNFCNNFSIMYSAKISIVDCLNKLKSSELFSKTFTDILDSLYVSVKGGTPMWQAMDKYPKVFPVFFRKMVKVGERANTLDKVLIQLSEYYQFNAEMRARTRSALVYPMLLLVLMIGTVAVMFLYVIPTFMAAFSSMEVTMPPLTMFVFNLSQWTVDHWQILLIVLVAIIVFCSIFFNNTLPGKYTSSWLALHVPLVRTVTVNALSAKFARSLSLLLMSSEQLIPSLETVKEVLENRIYIDKMEKVIYDVKYNGSALSSALEKYQLFDSIIPEIVGCGELAENVGGVLADSWLPYYRATQRAAETMATLMQPVTLVVMGGLVALMFLAVYSPVLAIIEQLL